MNALLLNGARDDALNSVQAIVAQELGDAGGVVDAIPLRETDIAYCRGCFGCWIQTPGLCIVDDAARDIARRHIQSDLVIYLTPVTFGGYSSELKKAVDRLIPNLSPFFTRIDGETHHKRRYARYPRLVAVGVLDEPDEESERLFKTLVSHNAINMHAPTHAAGVLHTGQGPEEMRAAIRALLAAVEVER
jgi:multimeric flavodoxin WrbA